MSNKSSDASETGSIFASGEVAEQWRRGAAQRDEVTGPASEMMLDLGKLGSGSRVLDVGGRHRGSDAHGSSTGRTDGIRIGYG